LKKAGSAFDQSRCPQSVHKKEMALS